MQSHAFVIVFIVWTSKCLHGTIFRCCFDLKWVIINEKWERYHPFTMFSSRSSCVQAGIMVERPNVVQQMLRLIELMRENAWMVDK